MAALFVPMVRGGDEDGVDVFAGENFAVVAGGEDVGAPEFFRMGESAVIAIGDGDEFHAGHLKRGASVALALNARADEGELDQIVWRARWSCGGLCEEGMQLGDSNSSGCGLESCLEERPAVYLVHEAVNGGPFSATNLDSFFLPMECKTGVATVSSHGGEAQA